MISRLGTSRIFEGLRTVRGLVEPRKAIGCPSQSGQADWGFRLRAARNKVLTLHAIPKCLSYALRRSGGADAGRAHYAALFHQRLHFT
jgi:hypothetical protein